MNPKSDEAATRSPGSIVRGWAPSMAVAAPLLAITFSAFCATQPTPDATHERGVQILFLGTSGGPPLRIDRSEPATLLEVDGERYLVDCGIGTARRLLRAGVDSQSVAKIFITHHHPDHDLGLADVMADAYFRMRMGASARLIDIYGPPQTVQFVKAAFDYIRIPYGVFAAEGRDGPPDPFSAHDIEHAGVAYTGKGLRVTAAENSHYRFMPRKYREHLKSYAYRFDTRHGAVVFTGDTGPSAAVARLAAGADVLVAEVDDTAAAMRQVNALATERHWTQRRRQAYVEHRTREHLGLKEVGELASKAHVGALLLHHFHPDDPEAWVAEIAKHYSGPIFAAADLDRYCLDAGKTARSGDHVSLKRCSTAATGKD